MWQINGFKAKNLKKVKRSVKKMKNKRIIRERQRNIEILFVQRLKNVYK